MVAKKWMYILESLTQILQKGQFLEILFDRSQDRCHMFHPMLQEAKTKKLFGNCIGPGRANKDGDIVSQLPFSEVFHCLKASALVTTPSLI